MTIIRFCSRTTRDLVWRKAEGCNVLPERDLRFTEALTALREKLWLLIDAGKKAHLAGVCVIMEGKDVRPSPSLFEEQHAQMDT